MDENIKMLMKKDAIKSEVKLSLTECLELLPLVKLKRIAEDYGLTGVSSAKKAKMVSLLFKAITENFLHSYVYFTDFQEKGFKKIIANQVLEDVNIISGAYYLLYHSGIAFYFYYNDKLYLTIPTEIVNIFKNANIDELNKIKDKNQEMHKYMKALCNLYGIYDSNQFITVFNKYHDEHLPEDEFVSYAEIMHYKQSYYSVDCVENNNCLVFVGEDEDGELFEMLCNNTHRPYYIPSKEEVDFFAEEPYEDTEQYTKFEKYVIDNKLVEGKELENFLDEIRANCQEDKHPKEILETVNRYGVSFKGLNDANELLGLIMDMSNHERKWVLKGYAPSMLRESSYKSNVIQFPNVGRNEPCPCGSGKKYKKCRGR